MRNLRRQLGVVVRGMLRQPGTLLPVLVILGAGLGAVSMAFSYFYAMLVQPMPFKEAHRLRYVVSSQPELSSRRTAVSYRDYEDWLRENEVFEDLAVASMIYPVVLTGGDRAEHLSMELVSWNLFPMLGIEAMWGRTITAAEDRMPSGQRVVMISHHLWQQRFGGNPDILGETVELNQVSFVVVGIIEPWFRGFYWEPVDLWLPVTAYDAVLREDLSQRSVRRLQTFARLKPGVTDAQARADMERVTASLEERHPDTNDGFRASVFTVSDAFFDHAKDRLSVGLLAAVLLLILCGVNVGGLLLTRAAGRDREMAMRLALGGGTSQLAQIWLLEGAVLGVVGGVVGLPVAMAASHWLIGLSDLPPSTFRFEFVQLPILAATLGLGLVVGIFTGLGPLLRLPALSNLQQVLRAGDRRLAGVGARPLVTIVVVELALALALLYGAGLMVASYQKLQRGNPGYDADQLLSMRVDFTHPRYAERERMVSTLLELQAEVTALPGVESAAWVGGLAPPDARSAMQLVVEDHLSEADPRPLRVYQQRVTPHFFETLGIERLSGRSFDPSDTSEAPPVAIVSSELARYAWPDEPNVLGKRLRFGQPGQSDVAWMTVVGVVETVVSRQLKDAMASGLELDIYTPLAQTPAASPTLMVRAQDPASLRVLVADSIKLYDPDVPTYEVGTLRSKIEAQALDDRFLGAVMMLFAGLALTVSVLGVYGVLAYLVRQRTREIGIRMALGADASKVQAMVLRQGAKWVLVGLCLGLPLAFWLSWAMQQLLFEVAPFEPFLLALALLALVVAACAALWVPARRATRVDPVVALRAE